MRFLVYMYYTHSGYQTSIFGKNCAYYIRIFTVGLLCKRMFQIATKSVVKIRTLIQGCLSA